MLHNVYVQMRQANPNWDVKKKHVIPPPIITKVGTKRVMWNNFFIIARLLARQEDHLKAFVLAELGTEGAIDGCQRLVIKGRYTGKQFESLLKKYIGNFIISPL